MITMGVETAKALGAAELHALVVLGRTADRDALPSGDHEIDMTLRVTGTLHVGADSVTAKTCTPDQSDLLAAILAKLNTVTREQILRELPEEFAGAGNRFQVPNPAIARDVKRMLQRLRRKVAQPRRGDVKADLDVAVVEETTPVILPAENFRLMA